jgi:hypothetical protein
MEELPISAGLQIIDADLYSKGIDRVWASGSQSFDSMRLIDEAFQKLNQR